MKKQIITIILFVIIYLIVSFITSQIYDSNKVIYIGNFTTVTIADDEMVVKHDNNKKSNEKIKVYFNNGFIDAYLSSEESDFYNSYYVYDNNKNRIQFEEDLLATSRNTNIKIVDLQTSFINSDEIESISNELDIDSEKIDKNNINKYLMDLDSDNEKEILYSVLVNDGDDNNKYLLVKSQNNIDVFESISYNRKSPNFKNISLYKVIDFNNDDIFEVVVKKFNGGDIPPTFDIYTYNNGMLTIIKE